MSRSSNEPDRITDYDLCEPMSHEQAAAWTRGDYQLTHTEANAVYMLLGHHFADDHPIMKKLAAIAKVTARHPTSDTKGET